MRNLNIGSNRGNNVINLNITDAIFYAINKYDSHPTILKIKEIMGVKNLFLSLQKLQNKKACQENNIPVKII